MDFIDDNEKMSDFFLLTKEEFLNSYSYLTEKEYNATKEKVDREHNFNSPSSTIKSYKSIKKRGKEAR